MDLLWHYSQILDELIANYDIMKTYMQNPEEECDEATGYFYINSLQRDVEVEAGASRLVLIDKECGFVVKIDVGWDDWDGEFCEREVHTYNMAKERGIAEYFVRPQYLGTYTNSYEWFPYYQVTATDFFSESQCYDDGYEKEEINLNFNLYSYPLVTEFGIKSHYLPQRYMQEAASYNHSPLNERQSAIAATFIQELGLDLFLKISNLLEEENINDMHGGNIGYMNGHLVIVDYAGYHER